MTGWRRCCPLVRERGARERVATAQCLPADTLGSGGPVWRRPVSRALLRGGGAQRRSPRQAAVVTCGGARVRTKPAQAWRPWTCCC
jgi:hypothetical protein